MLIPTLSSSALSRSFTYLPVFVTHPIVKDMSENITSGFNDNVGLAIAVIKISNNIIII